MAVGQAPIFLVERTLGRLARWLRLLGWDARLTERVPPAGRKGWVVLSRRRALAAKPGVLVVESDLLDDQLAQVLDELGLKLQPENFFSRCLDSLLVAYITSLSNHLPNYRTSSSGNSIIAR